MNYYDNPYHNVIHAIDATNSCCFLINCGLIEKLPQFEVITLLLSIFVHDVGHPGINNAFLIEMKSGEALIYNDLSVLENLHTALAFKLLNKPNSDITSGLNKNEYTKFRKLMIDLILATDLSGHTMLLTQFKNNCQDTGSFDYEDDTSRLLIEKMLIKASDIGHGAKTLEIHKQFSRYIIEEFYIQGDLE